MTNTAERIRGLIIEATREGAGRYTPEITASWVMRAVSVGAPEARAALLDLAVGADRTRLLDVFLVYRCPDHDTVLYAVKQGEKIPSEARCEEDDEVVRLDEANAEVVFKPTSVLQEIAKKVLLLVP